MKMSPLVRTAAYAALTTLGTPALAQEMTSFAASTELKVTTDQRSRGISDSLNRPGLKLGVQMAHESGLIGLVELVTVSKKQFLDGSGLGMTFAGGYRFGDPDGWHYGAGVATELFPGARFEAPHSFDMTTGTPGDWRSSNYNSMFVLAELGYGALEARVMNVVSKTYRGANTGGVCGTLLAAMPDPTQALECYARGNQNSKGTWLFDLGYTHDLTPDTKLKLHGGYQKVANFKEANFSDFAVGITHKRWGFDWSAEWLTTRTKVRELYQVIDGGKTRATDNNKLVVSVSRTF